MSSNLDELEGVVTDIEAQIKHLTKKLDDEPATGDNVTTAAARHAVLPAGARNLKVLGTASEIGCKHDKIFGMEPMLFPPVLTLGLIIERKRPCTNLQLSPLRLVLCSPRLPPVSLRRAEA